MARFCETADESLAHIAHVLLVIALDVVKLMLAHDGLADVESVHVAPVAHVAEAEVQVVAVEADPVTYALSQRHFLIKLV